MTSIFGYLIPVVLGAIIGAFTNKVALLMLFRPYNVKRIGKLRIPFTPGLIPKNRSRIARAIAENISSELLTPQSIKSEIKSSGIQKKLEDKITSYIYDEHNKVCDITDKLIPERDLLATKLSSSLTSYITQELAVLNLNAVVERMLRAVMEKMPFLNLLIGSKLDTISAQISQVARDYLKTDGKEGINKITKSKIEDVFDMQLSDFVLKLDIDKVSVTTASRNLTDRLIERISDAQLDVHIQKIVEDKINNMDMAEIERIIKNIAHKELKSLVFVGGVLGAIIGALNILLSMLTASLA